MGNQLYNLIKKLFYILTPAQKKLCVVMLLLTIFQSVLELIGVSAIIPVVQMLQDPDRIVQSSIVSNSDILRQLSKNQLLGCIFGIIIFIYLFKNAYSVFMSWMRIKFSSKIQRETAIRLMKTFMTIGYPYYINHSGAEYNQSVGSDSAAINNAIVSIFKIMSSFLTMIMIFILLILADWQLALAIVILSVICLLLIFKVFRRMIRESSIVARKYGIRMGQTVLDSYFAIKEILIFRKQKHYVYKYEKNSILTQKAQCRTTVGTESPSAIIEAICVSGLMLCIAFRVIITGASSEFIAVLAAFAVGAFRVMPSLGQISSAINLLSGSTASISALYKNLTEGEKYIKKHPETLSFVDNRNSVNALIDKGHDYKVIKKEKFFSTGKFVNQLEMQNVSFFYDKEYRYILKNINLKIQKGEAVGIIGESGAGKSTLVDILLGLLTPVEGKVMMDGQDIRLIPEKWSETIAYVPQDVFLFDDTIKRNIAFGEDDEEIDEDLVLEAIDKAELSDFIKELPNGINNKAGDRGVRLSGGQKQRIAIARALYHRPEILVLDEATSALDNNTESAIMEALNTLYGQITMIIVAHRLTTIKKCDRVYEVNNGQIIERQKEDIIKGE